MLTFAVEPLAPIWDEWMALVRLHWDETEAYRGEPLAPRKDAYLAYDKSGMLVFFTLRDDGKLVGYSGMYLYPSMHTSRLFAREDTWFLHPEYRKGFTVVRFVKFVEAVLKERGAESCWMSAKIANGAGRILEFLEYEPVSTVYVKNFMMKEGRHVRSRSAART